MQPKNIGRLKRNMDYLKVLSCCDKKMRSSIINASHTDLINTLCECILNMLNGNINIKDEDKSKLSKYKNSLRKLLKKISFKERKKILVQNGGFLQILLPSVITGLASIISTAISKE